VLGLHSEQPPLDIRALLHFTAQLPRCVPTFSRSPWQNGIAGFRVGTVRREFL